MESNDRPVAGIAFHVVDNIVGSEPFGVVAGNKIPHNNGELPAQPPINGVAHPSMRRTEQMGVDKFVGILNVIPVGDSPVLE